LRAKTVTRHCMNTP